MSNPGPAARRLGECRDERTTHALPPAAHDGLCPAFRGAAAVHGRADPGRRAAGRRAPRRGRSPRRARGGRLLPGRRRADRRRPGERVVDRAGLRPGGGCRMGEAAAGGSWQSRGAPHRGRCTGGGSAGRDGRRSPPRRRGGVAHRIGQARGRPRPLDGRRRARRGVGAGCPRRRARAVAGDRSAADARRLAHDGRQTPRDRRLAPARAARRTLRRAGPRPRTAGRRRSGGRGGRGDPGRPAPARVRVVPSRAGPRRPGRADPQTARRPDDRRDRAGLPGARPDHRAAHRARQAHAHRGPRAVRGARPRRLPRAAVVGAGGRLPDLQRGVLGHGGRRLAAASWPSSRRANRKCTAWSP